MARIIPFTDGMKIGLGYNRLTGNALSTPAVNVTSISSLQAAGGQRVLINCTTIQDVEILHKSLGISVDAGGSYFGLSGSAKFDYVNSCDFSSFSTYVVVRVSVKDATETIDSPTFSPDANELLVNNNPDRFRQRFGDTFIAGVLKGGEYFAIYQISGSDQTEKESVASNVQAAFNGVLASADLNILINTAKSQTKSHLEVIVHVFREGTIRTADLNIEDIIKTAKDFPVEVSGDKAFPYAVLLQDYDSLKNPNDQFVYIEIQNRQDVLEDLAKKRFEFLALRDNLKYILRYSDDFQNSDGTSVDRDKLSKDLDEVVDAINTMQREASVCVRDAKQCSFTKFEVGKFSIPVIKKKTLSRSDINGTWRTNRPSSIPNSFMTLSVNGDELTASWDMGNGTFSVSTYHFLNDHTITHTVQPGVEGFGEIQADKIIWTNDKNRGTFTWIKV
jgi:hypothetical protein